MSLFKNIKSFCKDSDQTELAVYKCYKNKGPNFISLKVIIKLERIGKKKIIFKMMTEMKYFKN